MYAPRGYYRNQESSSESINAYYALQLLGIAMNDDNMRDVGRVLLALETLGANTYWYPAILLASC